MPKNIHPVMVAEIKMAFDITKQSVSLLYSRLDLLDYPEAGSLAVILKELINLEKDALQYITE